VGLAREAQTFENLRINYHLLLLLFHLAKKLLYFRYMLYAYTYWDMEHSLLSLFDTITANVKQQPKLCNDKCKMFINIIDYWIM
jgi:hypothetical protein